MIELTARIRAAIEDGPEIESQVKEIADRANALSDRIKESSELLVKVQPVLDNLQIIRDEVNFLTEDYVDRTTYGFRFCEQGSSLAVFG